MTSFKKIAMEIIREKSPGSKNGSIPFIPRWDLMYNSLKINGNLPDELKKLSYYDATRHLGLGIASTRNKAFRTKFKNVEVIEQKSGYRIYTTIRTPFGDMTSTFQTTPQLIAHGVRGVVVDFPVKAKKDFDAACFIIENTEIISLHYEINDEISAVGDDGVVLAQAGYLPFHDFMRNWTGYENFYLLFNDHPAEVQKMLNILENKFEEITGILADCPADIVTVDGHLSTDFIPPHIYKKYFLDRFKSLSAALHKKGKFMCSHTDADIKGLLGLYLDSGFDIAESYTPPPMTSVSVQACFNVWNNNITIWGGLASVMFSAETAEKEFENHIYNIKEQSQGRKFIGGIGDNAPTDGLLSRLLKAKKILGEVN